MLPGPQKIDCPDGCGRFGVATRNGHVKGCTGPPGQPCYSCIGRRNRASGMRKQRLARGKLGIEGPSLGADHEENWRGAVRVEVKSGVQTHPAWTAYLKMEAQSEARKAIGDNRDFLAMAMPAGVSDGVAMIRVSKLYEVAVAIVTAGEGANYVREGVPDADG